MAPISAAKFIHVIREILVKAGLEKKVAANRTFNSLRRFLPTGADKLEFDDTMAAGIGNWQDARVGSGRRARSVRLPMFKRYADDKVHTAGCHKRMIVHAVMTTIADQKSRDTSRCTWADVKEKWTDLQELAVQAAKLTTGPVENTMEDQRRRKAPEEMVDFRWFMQFVQTTLTNGPPYIHFARLGDPAPLCRDSPFARAPAREGDTWKTAPVTSEQVCPRCLTRTGPVEKELRRVMRG